MSEARVGLRPIAAEFYRQAFPEDPLTSGSHDPTNQVLREILAGFECSDEQLWQILPLIVDVAFVECRNLRVVGDTEGWHLAMRTQVRLMSFGAMMLQEVINRLVPA